MILTAFSVVALTALILLVLVIRRARRDRPGIISWRP